MIRLLLFVARLMALVSSVPLPAATRIANGAADLFRNVLARVALVVFPTLLLLLLRSIVLDRYQDFR